jgi:hypothetical protein
VVEIKKSINKKVLVNIIIIINQIIILENLAMIDINKIKIKEKFIGLVILANFNKIIIKITIRNLKINLDLPILIIIVTLIATVISISTSMEENHNNLTKVPNTSFTTIRSPTPASFPTIHHNKITATSKPNQILNYFEKR